MPIQELNTNISKWFHVKIWKRWLCCLELEPHLSVSFIFIFKHFSLCAARCVWSWEGVVCFNIAVRNSLINETQKGWWEGKTSCLTKGPQAQKEYCLGGVKSSIFQKLLNLSIILMKKAFPSPYAIVVLSKTVCLRFSGFRRCFWKSVN